MLDPASYVRGAKPTHPWREHSVSTRLPRRGLVARTSEQEDAAVRATLFEVLQLGSVDEAALRSFMVEVAYDVVVLADGQCGVVDMASMCADGMEVSC